VRIIDAILAGNEEEAMRLLAKHLEGARDDLLSFLRGNASNLNKPL